MNGTLARRIASAVILAPLTLVMILAGQPWLQLAILAAAAGMSWEWGRLCTGSGSHPLVFAMMTAALVPVAVGGFGAYRWGFYLLIAGILVCFVWSRRCGRGRAVLVAMGPILAAVPCLAFIWLATMAAGGVLNVLWLLFVVWASDIGAYAVGRTVGGPRLAPRISPNKTWSGSIGGFLAAGVIGALASRWAGASNPVLVGGVSAVLALVAQGGDLAESLAKRYFGVKDTSDLIPGHGGVLDRLDSLLTATPVLVVVTLLGGSVLTWK